jgi:hypothetical protein
MTILFKGLLRGFCIGLFLFTMASLSASKASIYISPTGSDLNKGSYNAPLKTLKAALSLSRLNNIKKIYLRGGRYFDVSIDFLPVDSGLIIKNYRKERPFLYGGVIVQNLQKENHLVCTDLSENNKISDFRIIIVNGSLRERSRIPEKGYFNYLNDWNSELLPGVYGGWGRKPSLQELSEMRYSVNDFNSWKEDIANAEITLIHRWDESYLKVESTDTVKHTFHFTYPATNVPGAFNLKNYVVWNVRNGLKHEGQWFFNKTERKLYYWPYKEEVNKKIEIIVPTTRYVLNFKEGACNITIDGITIKASGNKLQNEDFASKEIDAAIDGHQVSNITIKNTCISQCSGCGIRLRGTNSTFNHIKIDHIGGTGIFTIGNKGSIRNCQINSVGEIFLSSVGIYSYGCKNIIQTSQINNSPYSGICFFGDSCVISQCTIKNAMTTLEDGGFIYGGIQKGGSVKENVIIGNDRKLRSVGIYLDEQSENTTVSNNFIYHSIIPVQCHLAKNSNFTNNVFWDNNPQNINFQRSFDLTFSDNVFIAEQINFDGPNTLDSRLDTNLLEVKFRYYANPTGIVGFKNNLLIIDTISKQNQLLPVVPSEVFSGSKMIFFPINKLRNPGIFMKKEKIPKLIQETKDQIKYIFK